MNALSLSNRKLRSAGNGIGPLGTLPIAAAFHHEMDQLLDGVCNGFGFTHGHRPGMLPTVEIQETDKEYRAIVDLPGVELQDIQLSFSEDVLTLKAERKIANDDNARYSARWSGSFERVISIGPDVDESGITATLKNGVLAVALPKKPERQPRRIQIE